MNFLSVQVAGVGPDGVRIASDASAMNAAAPLPVRCDAAAVGRRATLGIRPEHIHLRRASTGEVGLTARIESLEQLGATSFLYCVLSTGEKLTVQVAGQVESRRGEAVVVSFPADRAHLFDETDDGPAFERLHARATGRAG